MCIKITERKWWDLAIYNPNFDRNLLVFRIYPDMVMQEKLTLGIEKGKNLIKLLNEKYANRK